jgi:cellulose biosynthesis protein BcsQ
LSLLALNALFAYDGIIVPTEAKFLDKVGLSKLWNILMEIKKNTDKEIDVIRIVPNHFEKSVSLQKTLLNKLNELQIMVEERRSLLAGMLSNVKFIEKEDKSLQKKKK